MQIIFDKKISNENQDKLKSLIEESISIVQLHLNIGGLTFKVYEDEGQIIPEWGVGGYYSNDVVELFIGKNRLIDSLTHLPRTIYHELHHAARSRLVDLDGQLIDLIISEGLAQHFEVEIDGGPPSFFSNFLSDDIRDSMIEILKNELSDTNYDHARWFFGARDFPFQAGYDLSYHLVGLYIEKTKMKPSELIGLSREDFKKVLSP